jgi:hypothetical protein
MIAAVEQKGFARILNDILKVKIMDVKIWHLGAKCTKF